MGMGENNYRCILVCSFVCFYTLAVNIINADLRSSLIMVNYVNLIKSGQNYIYIYALEIEKCVWLCCRVVFIQIFFIGPFSFVFFFFFFFFLVRNEIPSVVRLLDFS